MPNIIKTHGGKHEIRFTDAGHSYKVDGVKKQGVTTVLKILDKPGLLQWASNKACEWIRINAIVQTTLTGEKVFQVSEEHLKVAKNAHNTLRDDAAGVGKLVHKWIEDYIAGNVTEFTEVMSPSVKAFLKWEEENKPEYINSERVTYSEELDLCGTSDLLCVIDGKRTILDFKTGHPEKEYDAYRKRYTGRTRAYSTVFMQDAFYDIAMAEEDGAYAEQYGVLYLPLDGGAFPFYSSNVDFWKACARSVLGTNNLVKEADRLVNAFAE